ncbi:hypothetical protein FRX31_009564, partial [Thalictrum thalictroides]
RKQTYNRECRMCSQPFTVVDWPYRTPDNEYGRKSTQICFSCTKLHIVCQCCGRGPQLEDEYTAILHSPIREHQEVLDRVLQTLQENIRLGRVIYGPLHRPNNIRFAYILTSLLKACSGLSDVRMVRTFHGMIVKSGVEFDRFVETALLCMYRRWFEVDSAGMLSVIGACVIKLAKSVYGYILKKMMRGSGSDWSLESSVGTCGDSG